MKSLGPTMPVYVDDFLGGITHLSDGEVGAYWLLLLHQWQHGSIPNEQKIIARIARRQHSKLQRVLEKFVACDDGMLRNKKMDSVRAERIAYQEVQRLKAQKRWDAAACATALPVHMPEGMPEGYSASASASAHEEEDKSGAAKRARFTPPTVEEVRAYVASLGANIDAQKFVDFYEASGWMRGKTAIKSWKACVRTWRRDDAKPKPAAPGRWVDPHADVIPGLTDYRGGKA